MVRAHMKHPSEEKKETPKKKTPSKKKTTVTGVWPCKINGCNKEFAREADLKRHQRTTKLHSMPGFACPQCDATFTRTDALRRHQKSRHNGVVIEPAEANKKKNGEDEQPQSSGSRSRSRSGSPSAKGKGKVAVAKSTPPAALAMPATSGPTSYYRQHTATSTGFPQPHPPPGVMTDPQYAQGIALPTSATRLHQASWPPPPPWATDAQAHTIGHLAYHQIPGSHIYYQPSPYYRSNGGLLPPQTQSPHQPQVNPDLVTCAQASQNGTSSKNDTPGPENGTSRTNTPMLNSVVDPRLNPNSSQRADVDMAASDSTNTQGEGQSYPSAPVIDPSLDASTSTTTSNTHHGGNDDGINRASNEAAMSLKITQAAMEAVLNSVIHESKFSDEPSRESDAVNGQAGKHSKSDVDIDAEGDADVEVRDELLIASELSPGQYHTPLHLDRPEPMEHILTEDGEPMLNPAELLTQESLASPPPS